MQLKDILQELNHWSPFAYAEDFDNVGLLVGDENQEVEKVLVCLDSTEEVVDEAMAQNVQLIIAFHPIIFTGLKSITGKNYVERVVAKSLANNISIIAVHTALDNSPEGVSFTLGKALGLTNLKVLLPKSNSILMLKTYAPLNQAFSVRKALFEAGAGQIGDYNNCSFNWEGKGTFRSPEGGKPFVGEVGQNHVEKETCIQVILPKHLKNRVLGALFSNHPYEEVAYELIELENVNQNLGMGMIGELDEPQSEQEFLNTLCDKLNQKYIRHSQFLNKPIKKVAVLGGSGSFAISAAMAQKADAYVTADLKYHDFFNAEQKILLCDVGHFESEQFTIDLIVKKITEIFPNFAVLKTGVRTNPVHYFGKV